MSWVFTGTGLESGVLAIVEGSPMAAVLNSHYQVLGLSHRATENEIRDAYRQQLARFRAAMNAEERPDPAQLDQLRAAFTTLSDPVARQVYDAQLFKVAGASPTAEVLLIPEPAAAGEPPPPARAAPESPGGASRQVLGFEFVGSGGEYFRIWIVNLCLNLLTLGIYSAWAKVRREQYFHRNLLLDGSAFDYHGEPRAILRGRCVAVILLLLVSSSEKVSPELHAVALLALLLVSPWFIIRALSFRAYNTSYRGLRFGFSAGLGETYKLFLINLLLTIVTLGLFFPRLVREVRKFIIDHARFGRTAFHCEVTLKAVYTIFLLPFAIVLLAGLLAAIGGTKVLIGVLMLGFVVLYLLLPSYLGARLSNAVWSATTLGSHRFGCQLPLGKYVGMTLANWLLIACTLGFYIPWARVRMARLRADYMQLTVCGSLDDFLANESRQVSAFGEEGAEMFDMDVAL